MVKRFFVLLAILISLLWVSSTVASPNIKEGLWEITTKMDMPGMPIAIPPHTHTQCITKEDLVPQKPEKSMECEITSRKIVGNTVSWTMECRSKEGITIMNGKITYKGDRFDGEIKIKTPDGMEMTQHISGKRIGECK